jgi:ABC-2 type transport system permease protein
LRALLGTLVGKRKSGDIKKATAVRILGVVALYTFVIAMFISLSALVAYEMGRVLIPLGASWLYFSLFMLASLSVIFIFSIFETKSELFECKDNDLLLSMPIKPKDIVASRILVVLIYNYVEGLVVLLPCIIVYAVFSLDIVGIIGGFLVLVFIPIIATALASAVGYLVAMISKKLKKNSFLIVGISIIFMLVYFWGYNALIDNFNAFLENIQEAGGVDGASMPLMYYIGSAALLKPICTLIFICASIGIGALAYFVISKSYIKIVTDNYGFKKAVYKSTSYKAKRSLYALVAKELKFFSTSATYMLNSGIGLIFEVIVGVLAVINRSAISEIAKALFANLSVSWQTAIMPSAVSAILLFSSLNVMSACSLSLEGKQLWILKTVPLKDREVLISKFIPQIILTVPPTLLCSILFMIAVSAPVEYWLFFVLTPIFANIFSAIFGVVVNVAFPKFDFENEVQPIKQSLSVFIVMMAGMLITTVLLIGSFVLSLVIHPMLVCLIQLILYLALSVIFYLILMGPSLRKYAKIEV